MKKICVKCNEFYNIDYEFAPNDDTCMYCREDEMEQEFGVSEVIDKMFDASNETLEVALNCQEQGIDDVIYAYYLITMHNLKLIRKQYERI